MPHTPEPPVTPAAVTPGPVNAGPSRVSNPTCRYCGEDLVEKRAYPGTIWTTPSEEVVCDRNAIGHDPVRICTTEWCEDYGDVIADAKGLTCPECGLPGVEP